MFSWSKKGSSTQKKNVVMQGLDAGGKTTIIYRLWPEDVKTEIPTIGFNIEVIENKNIRIITWDVGGRCNLRPLWRHYYKMTDGLVFVIDSNDRDYMAEVPKWIKRAMDEEGLSEVPVLIIAHKQDLPNALSPLEISKQLDLETLLKGHQWNIFGTTAILKSGNGLDEAFEWLSSALGPEYAGSFQKESIFERMTRSVSQKLYSFSSPSKASA
eukprot:TRINITY_DN314_c0_g1_i2.p1 TRINITY_DN314_c0_g1~~TRINITY_DN314_c0_g1_i2.p1  ORF type:complete len:213 (-),score=40.75 TRINITY_DN314_c0_g1_i2:286-924(-)